MNRALHHFRVVLWRDAWPGYHISLPLPMPPTPSHPFLQCSGRGDFNGEEWHAGWCGMGMKLELWMEWEIFCGEESTQQDLGIVRPSLSYLRTTVVLE